MQPENQRVSERSRENIEAKLWVLPESMRSSMAHDFLRRLNSAEMIEDDIDRLAAIMEAGMDLAMLINQLSFNKHKRDLKSGFAAPKNLSEAVKTIVTMH